MYRTTSVRQGYSLADKLRQAVTGGAEGKKKGVVGTIAVKDEQGEDFRELFVMPKRKLRGQLQLEQSTGRAEIKQRSRNDLNDRLAARRPRSEEMNPEQDWTNVWPAARSFSASVVPLPVRMGSRPNVEKRAPFKKEGNLELVKIPNFLHLTPAAIEKHCKALQKFCTPYPQELLDDAKLVDSELPVSVSYSTYVHQGTNIRDMRSRVVTFKIDVGALNLKEKAKEKLIRLAGTRFDESSNILTIITDRCHTRKQNLDYAYYLLTVLYHEANKVEAWEKGRERLDNLKVSFDGSRSKEKLVDLLSKISQVPQLDPAVKGEGKDVAEHEKVAKFAKMWQRYRNTEESAEATREYGRMMKELLGLPKNSSPSSHP
ncbi:unnamed protein product [Caenorhabditis auriculariae]|uniref:Small ribosomal subunit protein mS35 mitochondrial conserved domain-containing protein n=1 Tax=Caenorhabditis auriculariae TaxID=2777116 RepID=A0A8S1GUX3_9PELO|nr:unnamed protein product [Caenorhabditis auriculariae]